MIVCGYCLQEIESREGCKAKRKVSSRDNIETLYGDYDEDGNFVEDMDCLDEYARCEFCDEVMPMDLMYEI